MTYTKILVVKTHSPINDNCIPHHPDQNGGTNNMELEHIHEYLEDEDEDSNDGSVVDDCVKPLPQQLMCIWESPIIHQFYGDGKRKWQ